MRSFLGSCRRSPSGRTRSGSWGRFAGALRSAGGHGPGSEGSELFGALGARIQSSWSESYRGAFGSSGFASSSTASRLARGVEGEERSSSEIFGSRTGDARSARRGWPAGTEVRGVPGGRCRRSSDRLGRLSRCSSPEELEAHGGRDRRNRASRAFGGGASRDRDAASSWLEGFEVPGGRSRCSFGSGGARGPGAGALKAGERWSSFRATCHAFFGNRIR